MASKPAEGKAIGIDLGTTYSCVRVWQHDRVEIVPNNQGNRTTPSYIAFTDTERLIGDATKNQVAMNPHNTVFDAKRLISRRFSDASVQSNMKHQPFEVVPSPGDKPMIVVCYKGEEKQFSPEEISSMVLVKMREISEAFLGHPINNDIATLVKKQLSFVLSHYAWSVKRYSNARRHDPELGTVNNTFLFCYYN